MSDAEQVPDTTGDAAFARALFGGGELPAAEEETPTGNHAPAEGNPPVDRFNDEADFARSFFSHNPY